MAEPTANWQGRKPVNVVDLDLQAQVEKLANEAMRSVVRGTFHSRDAAARACGLAMQPITNKYGVEIGSLLFSLTGDGTGLTRVGSPVAGRENCRLSYQCGVVVQNGGWVPGGLLSGYVHSHPIEARFSGNDLYVASIMQKQVNAAQDVTAYVSLPSGRLFAWSVRNLRDHPQRTWSDYATRTTREVR